ncbi:hypothetical protein MSG28_002622 [Choristoneura fumiferana]|uniref:Uncharacterized protein n=1 Tax=Choristoneura fumiferana TaxID=7141 RepID=A0ACC0JIL7_CHOFU|nr:hypothetical protein MSG28_002622 [Choristoneura fumiferana]
MQKVYGTRDLLAGHGPVPVPGRMARCELSTTTPLPVEELTIIKPATKSTSRTEIESTVPSPAIFTTVTATTSATPTTVSTSTIPTTVDAVTTDVPQTELVKPVETTTTTLKTPKDNLITDPAFKEATKKPEITIKMYPTTIKFKPKEIWIKPAQKEPEHITAVMGEKGTDRSSVDLISVISIAGGVMMTVITVAVVIVMLERCKRPRFEDGKMNNIRMQVMIDNSDGPPPYVRSIFNTPLPEPPNTEKCHYQPISTLDRNLKQFMRPVVVQTISPMMLENFRGILECHYDHLPRRSIEFQTLQRRRSIAPSMGGFDEPRQQRPDSLAESTIEALKCEAKLDVIDNTTSEPLYAEIPCWRPPSEHAVEIIMRGVILLSALLAAAWAQAHDPNADAQYIKSVKGGGGGQYNYRGGDSFNRFFNNTQGSHGLSTNHSGGFSANQRVGICIIEVPTATLARDPKHVPAGNGSRSDLSRIETCCPGYIRNIHNFRLCDPVCTTECVNALCTAPNTCTCFPDHVMNNAGFCVATCPIGCQNGHCAGGECLCKDGFKLDRNGKFCEPHCRENCGGVGNCTAPNTCSCKPGFHSTPEGSCKQGPPSQQRSCGNCVNGDCVGTECRCRQGYLLYKGECLALCYPSCGPNTKCVAPNLCSAVPEPNQSNITGQFPNQITVHNQYPYPNQPQNNPYGQNQGQYPGQHPQNQNNTSNGQYPYPSQNPYGQNPNKPPSSIYAQYPGGQPNQYPQQPGQYPQQPQPNSNLPNQGQYPQQPGQQHLYPILPGIKECRASMALKVNLIRDNRELKDNMAQNNMEVTVKIAKDSMDHNSAKDNMNLKVNIVMDSLILKVNTIKANMVHKGNLTKDKMVHKGNMVKGNMVLKDNIIKANMAECQPYCHGGCHNGFCTAPNTCACDAGYHKDFSVKGRAVCIKRERRSIEEKPINVAELLVFEIPEYAL